MNDAVKDIEKKAFRSFWGDGLLDVMVGLAVLVMGISWWQDVAVMGAIFPAVCVSMWYPLRKRLVEPRMGYVEFSGDREIKVRSFRYGLFAFFTGTMMLGLVIYFLWNSDILSQPAHWIAGFPLVLIGIPAVFFALFTKCWRFAIYGMVLFQAGVEVAWQGWDPHVGMIASGTLITVVGMVFLVRFLSRYPAKAPGSP
jgi:MFS family permease